MVNLIRKNSEKFFSAVEKNAENIKLVRKADKKDVEEELLKYFQQKGNLNVLISGPILMSNSEQLTKIVNL